jgi:hypothetical protein
MTGAEFNWTPLVHSYSNGGAYAAIIDYLASRRRDPRNRETKVGNLAAELAARGHQFHFAELENALKVFHEANCAIYHRGRPLEHSRLNWEYSAREVAQEVLARLHADTCNSDASRDGLPQSLEGRNGAISSQGSDVPMETYRFPVRRSVMMEFKIRADMTTAEINNLADFVRIIAASRSSGLSEE